MKKFILSIILLALSLAAYSQNRPQIPNGDFESWTFDGANLPDNFNSFQTADGKYASTAYKEKNRQVERSTDTRPGSDGSYSCRIWSREINAVVVKVVAQGNLTSGRVHAGAMSATDKENYNYSDRDGSNTKKGVNNPCAMVFKGRPDSLVAWVKFSPKGKDTKHPYAMINAYIHDDFDYRVGYKNESDASHLVAKAMKEFSSTDGKWERLSIPFEYGDGAEPEYILINISTNSYPGGGSEGDQLYVDDMELVYLDKYNLSVPASCGWATLYLDFDAAVPDGAIAYYATEFVGGYVRLQEIPSGEIIPAHTPVLISSSRTNLSFLPVSGGTSTVVGNILSGTLEEMPVEEGYDYYVLSGDATTPGSASFARFKGSTLSANKAFIRIKK